MITSITGHAVERWMERVNKTATFDVARQEIEAFMASASIERKPRNWMRGEEVRQRRLAQIGVKSNHDYPTAYAYNDEWGGICLLLAMTEKPFVVTLVTRTMERELRQRQRELEVSARKRNRTARQARYQRRINTEAS